MNSGYYNRDLFTDPDSISDFEREMRSSGERRIGRDGPEQVMYCGKPAPAKSSQQRLISRGENRAKQPATMGCHKALGECFGSSPYGDPFCCAYASPHPTVRYLPESRRYGNSSQSETSDEHRTILESMREMMRAAIVDQAKDHARIEEQIKNLEKNVEAGMDHLAVRLAVLERNIAIVEAKVDCSFVSCSSEGEEEEAQDISHSEADSLDKDEESSRAEEVSSTFSFRTELESAREEDMVDYCLTLSDNMQPEEPDETGTENCSREEQVSKPKGEKQPGKYETDSNQSRQVVNHGKPATAKTLGRTVSCNRPPPIYQDQLYPGMSSPDVKDPMGAMKYRRAESSEIKIMVRMIMEEQLNGRSELSEEISRIKEEISSKLDCLSEKLERLAEKATIAESRCTKRSKRSKAKEATDAKGIWDTEDWGLAALLKEPPDDISGSRRTTRRQILDLPLNSELENPLERKLILMAENPGQPKHPCRIPCPMESLGTDTLSERIRQDNHYKRICNAYNEIEISRERDFLLRNYRSFRRDYDRIQKSKEWYESRAFIHGRNQTLPVELPLEHELLLRGKSSTIPSDNKSVKERGGKLENESDISKKITQDRRDPDGFPIACIIKGFPFRECVLDFDASSNVISFDNFDKLGMQCIRDNLERRYKTTWTKFQPVCMARNVEVLFRGYTVEMDFLVVMTHGAKLHKPLLGKPFINTMNVKTGEAEGVIRFDPMKNGDWKRECRDLEIKIGKESINASMGSFVSDVARFGSMHGAYLVGENPRQNALSDSSTSAPQSKNGGKPKRTTSTPRERPESEEQTRLEMRTQKRREGRKRKKNKARKNNSQIKTEGGIVNKDGQTRKHPRHWRVKNPDEAGPSTGQTRDPKLIFIGASTRAGKTSMDSEGENKPPDREHDSGDNSTVHPGHSHTS